MRVRRILVPLVIGAIVAAILVRVATNEYKARKLAADSHTALVFYSRNLRPGLTRREVDDYLLAHNAHFFERCCYEERTAFATLVKVGDAAHVWYCGEWPIYVAFEFTQAGTDHPILPRPSDADVLKHVHLVSNSEGCL